MTSTTSTSSTSSWAVTPGEWYAVLGETTAVLLPPSSRERAPAIWEKVDEGAGFDEVLDALISRGLRQLPAFVLASAEGGDVKVVVRGEGEVELDTREGPETVIGSHDTTWVERNVAGVTRIRIRVAPGDGAPYPVAGGLVRVCEVERPPRAYQTPAPPEPAPAQLAPAPEPQPEPLPEPEPEPLPEPPPEPPQEPQHRAPKRILPPMPPELMHSEDEPMTEQVPGVPPPAHAAPALRLVFSSGEVVDLDRAVVVGRSPDPRRGSGDALLVTVPSPHQEISSTHVEIRPATGGTAVVATDLGSTNGTVAVQPGQPAQDLQPGIGVELGPGAVIDLGEGQTIQIRGV